MNLTCGLIPCMRADAVAAMYCSSFKRSDCCYSHTISEGANLGARMFPHPGRIVKSRCSDDYLVHTSFSKTSVLAENVYSTVLPL